MGNQISVNTQGLENAVPGIEQLATRFADILSSLSDTLNGLGEPWGTDPSGKDFVKNYSDPNQKVVNGIGDTKKVVESTADGVRTMAEGFAATEEQNQASIDVGGSSSDSKGSPSARYPAD